MTYKEAKELIHAASHGGSHKYTLKEVTEAGRILIERMGPPQL